MSAYIDGLSPKEWERFCAIMLRHHYGARNIWEVPDKDGGDLGIEFYTADGTLFQCYYPDTDTDMAGYKKKVKNKINTDLKKLAAKKDAIAAMLDDITVDQWVLIIPELKSKDLNVYCNKKKKEVLKQGLPFIDASTFQVKIETPDSFPEGKLFATSIQSKIVNIPIAEVTAQDKADWQQDNSEFAQNISRKSSALISSQAGRFQDQVVTKYIQIERFLDQLRQDHPDLHELVEDSARAQLETMKQDSLFKDDLDRHFVEGVIRRNEEAFKKHSQHMSAANSQSLSFGYLSKWLAECYMDFTHD